MEWNHVFESFEHPLSFISAWNHPKIFLVRLTDFGFLLRGSNTVAEAFPSHSALHVQYNVLPRIVLKAGETNLKVSL